MYGSRKTTYGILARSRKGVPDGPRQEISGSRALSSRISGESGQKERLDILYRTILEAEAGNLAAKALLAKLVRPTPAMGLVAGAGLGSGAVVASPLRFGLLGAIASAGLGWLLSDKEDEDAE